MSWGGKSFPLPPPPHTHTGIIGARACGLGMKGERGGLTLAQGSLRGASALEHFICRISTTFGVTGPSKELGLCCCCTCQGLKVSISEPFTQVSPLLAVGDRYSSRLGFGPFFTCRPKCLQICVTKPVTCVLWLHCQRRCDAEFGLAWRSRKTFWHSCFLGLFSSKS